MSCPYLTEITMAFCRAFPVKKLVPAERVGTDSACDGEAFVGCPVFREALARRQGVASSAGQELHAAEVKEGGGS